MNARQASLRRDEGVVRAFSDTFSDRPYPKQVVFETTAYCNLSCPMCSQPTMLRPKGRMDPALFQKVVDEVGSWPADDLQIWFAVHGEALLLGPRLREFVEYARAHAKAELCLNTNGLPAWDTHAPWLAASPLDKIIISIDGHSAETYEHARRGGKYATVVQNTLLLARLLAARPEPKPRLVVQMVLMPSNVHEKEPFREFWTAQGLEVKFKPYLEWAGACKAEGDLRVPAERVPCQWISSSIHILWDGRVPQCGPDTECSEPMGNVTVQTLQEIWQGAHRERRLTHLGRAWDRLPAICRGCNDWAAGPAEWMGNRP